jgi:uncharacterized OB-fold protein
VSATLAPYFDGLASSEFRLPWCRGCGRPHFYPRSACPYCWGEDYDWRPASGRGRIHTYTVVRANSPSSFQARLPYAIAIVELDEGVRLLTNFDGSLEETSIDDPVAVDLDGSGQGYRLISRRLPNDLVKPQG